MNRLPEDTLHEIFTHMNLGDRIKCMSVCRRWEHVLDSQSLLYSVFIETQGMYDKFIDMVERLHFRSNQVEILSLSNCFSPNFDKRKLFRLFPNLRVIYFFDDENTIQGVTNFCTKRFESKASTSKVEELIDVGEFELTQYLATSNLCMKLTTLYLQHDSPFYDGNQIVDKLINMHVLEHLLIKLNNVSFDDLEVLHRNIPSLNKLNLQTNGNLTGDLPNYISAAPLLNDFSLFNCEQHNAEILIKWTSYVVVKYPRLTKFSFSVFEKKTLDERNEIFRNGIFPLLKAYGAQIKSLMTNALPEDINLFTKLDEFICQIKDFGHLLGVGSDRVLESIHQTKQIKYIESLLLIGLDRYPLHLLQDMESLKELCIYNYRNSNTQSEKIYIDYLLEKCPMSAKKIEARSISIKPLDIAFLPVYPICNHEKHLTKVSKPISTCIMTLHSLSLAFSLPHTALLSLLKYKVDYIDLTIQAKARGFYISFKQMDYNEALSYLVIKGDQDLSKIVYAQYTRNNYPVLYVELGKVRFFSVNDYRIIDNYN